jgi:hypothetical protein
MSTRDKTGAQLLWYVMVTPFFYPDPACKQPSFEHGKRIKLTLSRVCMQATCRYAPSGPFPAAHFPTSSPTWRRQILEIGRSFCEATAKSTAPKTQGVPDKWVAEFASVSRRKSQSGQGCPLTSSAPATPPPQNRTRTPQLMHLRAI